MFQQNPIKTFLDLFLSRLKIKDKNKYDMCICSRKYGSYSNNFFSEHARNELAKQLPLKMQKWVEKIIKNIIEMELGQKEATVIFSKGKIYTMNDKQPIVEAVAISGKRILFTGSEEEAMKLKTPQTTIIDLGGKTMLPGFIDPHVHLVFASMQHWVDLGPFVNSNMAQVKSKLIEAIKNHKDPNVILTCQLFDPKIIPGEKHDFDFSRKGLDSLTQTVPIFIYEDNGHVAHVNSAALNLVKINDSTPDPPHGRFIRDENGVLTGEVQQTALAFFKNKFPHITKQQYINHAKKLLQKCASKGCTTLHDAGIGSADPDADLSIIYEIAGENSPVRLSGFLVSNYWKKWQELKMVPEYKDVNLRIHGIKCWSDGSTQAGSAYLREDYLVKEWGKGAANYTASSLYSSIKAAHDAGWQVGVHSNGDAAIDMTLDALAAVQKQNPNFELRHRIEHATICHEEHLERMKSLHVTPSFLIGHIFYYGRIFQQILGEKRAFRIDPVNSAFKLDLKPTLHSDYNCQPIDPLRYVHNAVTRKVMWTGKILNKEQCMTPYHALHAVTINAAWQCHMEDIVGSIEVGKMADFVILEQNPLYVDPEQIRKIKIHATWKDGRITYKHE